MIETIRMGAVNVYLLYGERHSILVDTGPPACRERIYEQAKNAHVGLIVLTHGHNDHIGGAAWLSEKLGAPIAMHEADIPLCRDNTLCPLYASTAIGKLIKLFSAPLLHDKGVPRFDPAVLLRQGDSLDGYGVKAKVLELPGHTPGSIGLLAARAVIAGDAMTNVARPTAARLYADQQKMLDSMERIRESGARTAYVGHGSPVDLKRFFTGRKGRLPDCQKEETPHG